MSLIPDWCGTGRICHLPQNADKLNPAAFTLSGLEQQALNHPVVVVDGLGDATCYVWIMVITTKGKSVRSHVPIVHHRQTTRPATSCTQCDPRYTPRQLEPLYYGRGSRHLAQQSYVSTEAIYHVPVNMLKPWFGSNDYFLENRAILILRGRLSMSAIIAANPVFLPDPRYVHGYPPEVAAWIVNNAKEQLRQVELAASQNCLEPSPSRRARSESLQSEISSVSGGVSIKGEDLVVTLWEAAETTPKNEIDRLSEAARTALWALETSEADTRSDFLSSEAYSDSDERFDLEARTSDEDPVEIPLNTSLEIAVIETNSNRHHEESSDTQILDTINDSSALVLADQVNAEIQEALGYWRRVRERADNAIEFFGQAGREVAAILRM